MPAIGTALLLAPAGASAQNSLRHIGGVGTGAAPTTVGPDLRSVAVEANDLNDGLGERARFCFDSNIANVGNGWVLMSYDARRFWSGTASRAADDEKCAIVTFPSGSDIGQATVGQVGGGAVTDVANKPNIVASEPVVSGFAGTTGPGRTTGPDLVSVETDVSNPDAARVKFTFDEALDPSPTRPDNADEGDAPQDRYDRADFGYVLQDGAPVFLSRADAPQPSGNSITINFGNAPIGNAVRFVTNPGAVQDRPQSAVLGGSGLTRFTASAPGIVVRNPATGGRPDLAKAEPAGPNAYKLTFNAGVANPRAARFVAIADDGLVSATAASVGTGGTQDSVLVTFPDTEALTKDPGSIVAIVAYDGAVDNSTDNTKKSIYAVAPTNTPNDKPGFTNGPDLVGVVVDPSTQRTVFGYDEPIAAGSAAGNYIGFRSDATSEPGQGTVATSNANSTVTFGAGIGDLVAYGQAYNTVTDPVGRPNPNQSVSRDIEQAPATPTPPVTTTPPAKTRTVYSTSFRSFKKTGRARFSGRISSTAKTCRYKRRVILRKSGKGTTRYGQAFTRSDGTFTIRRKTRLTGRLQVVLTGKTTSTANCKTAKSKRIRG